MNQSACTKTQPEIDSPLLATSAKNQNTSASIEKDILLHKIVRLSHKLPGSVLPLAVSLLETLVEHSKLRQAA